MKIIQSYWSKPAIQGNNEHIENRYNGGYESVRDQYVGYALSCLKFRQFYDNVELYTDKAGYQLLIEKLKLPYTKVHVCLDELNYVPPLLWSISKIYTYSLQDEPFIHADTDVFIWKKFNKELESSPLIAQHLEESDFYKQSLDFIFEKTDAIPTYIKEYDIHTEGISSINAGIFGGSDIAFIKKYCQEALDFFHHNLEILAQSEKAGMTNIIIEQYLFYRLAMAQGKTVNFLLENVLHDYSDLASFHLVPKSQYFIHLVGTSKAHPLSSSMINRHLRLEFPEYYDLIHDMFKDTILTKSLSVEKKEEVDVIFEKTLSALHYYNLIETKASLDYDALQDKVKQLQKTTAQQKVQQFLAEVFEFENAKYLLNQDSEEIYNEEHAFASFSKNKKLIATLSDEDIMAQKYFIIKPLKVALHTYDVLGITFEPDWLLTLEEKLESIEADEVVYLLTKVADNVVAAQQILETEQLLYYFSYEPISGIELAHFLAGDQPTEKSLDYYKSVALDIIIKALTYGGHIMPVNEGATLLQKHTSLQEASY